MTRQEEIQKAAIETRCAVATSVSGDNFSSIDDLPFIEGKLSYDELVEEAFIKGVMWADAHPAKRQTATIDAWVARNKCIDNYQNTNLFLGKERPTLYNTIWCSMEEYYPLPQDALPFVTFENSPKKVKVTIDLEDEV